MNTITARRLAAHAAELIELSSIFQSRYGKNARMKACSPDEAWDLYRHILGAQVAIARLLDTDALVRPARRLPTWWKWQDAMDTCSAGQVAQEVFHLIACCASFEAQPLREQSPVIEASQRAIAGGLHPSTLLMALDERPAAARAS